jgi:hypothetical protein
MTSKRKKRFRTFSLADLIKFAGGEKTIIEGRNIDEAYLFLIRKHDEFISAIHEEYEETEELHTWQIAQWVDDRMVDDRFVGQAG